MNNCCDSLSKSKYINFCDSCSDIPVFSQAWWLDSVCGDKNWDVIIVEEKGEIIASMPYYTQKRKGFSFIEMPKLTQNMGVWIKYPPNSTSVNILSLEKKVMNELIVKLPCFSSFTQNFHYNITNWLPFYWNSFQQTTNYTYVIENISDIERVYSEFHRSKKKNIKKAEKTVKVGYDLSAKDFYENHKLTLGKQNSAISYSFNVFEKLYNNAYKNNQGRVIYAYDEENNIHGALFVVWDKNSAYDLISTIDPDYRNSGAASLLIYRIIDYLKDKVDKFDFEGSMIENVENSFRSFGAVQKPYFKVTKVNSKFLRFSKLIKEIR